MSSSSDNYYDYIEEKAVQAAQDKAEKLGIPVEVGYAINNLMDYINHNQDSYSLKFYNSTKRYFDVLAKYKI